jgi:hypothetical protein
MNFNETAVAPARTSEIFGKKISFLTLLLMNKTVDIKQSAKQKIPFLESAGGMTIWFGKSVKALLNDNGAQAFAEELRSNPTQYEVGLLVKKQDGSRLADDEQPWILYRKGDNAATVLATIATDDATGALKVAAVKP